jgi:copper chaperone
LDWRSHEGVALQFSVPDMTCAQCKAAVEAALARLAPGLTVAVDLPARRLTVEGRVAPAAVIAALAAAGFPATAL